jgi:hypothetical protein
MVVPDLRLPHKPLLRGNTYDLYLKNPAAVPKTLSIQTARIQRGRNPTKSEGSFGRKIRQKSSSLKQGPFFDIFAIWSLLESLGFGHVHLS